MPLQNRVHPTGILFSTPERGMFAGNRNHIFHNNNHEVISQHTSKKSWITCRLEFNNQKLPLMGPGHYTVLFFMDEAVSFAAGHRPCGRCRKDDYKSFQRAWVEAGNPFTKQPPPYLEMDNELHRARLNPSKQKQTYQASLHSLPDGTFIQHADDTFHLVYGDYLYLWSPGRYVSKQARSNTETVTVVTPEPLVRCLSNGYKLTLHQSINELLGTKSAGTHG